MSPAPESQSRKRHSLHNAALALFLFGVIAILTALVIPEIGAVPRTRTDIILSLLGTGFCSLVTGALFSGIGSHLLTRKESESNV